jgi:spore germination protein GerM
MRPVTRTAVTLALALAVAITVGCGVPVDGSPRAISEDEIPEELVDAPTTTSTPTDGAVQADLFFIEAEEGQGVLRREQTMVSDRSSGTVLDALVATIPEDLPEGVTSSIPEGTVILGTEVDDGVLTIDLSEEFEEVSADLLIQAVGQLVYTAMASSGVSEGVVFTVEGEARTFPDAEGSEITGPAGLSDYSALLPDA